MKKPSIAIAVAIALSLALGGAWWLQNRTSVAATLADGRTGASAPGAGRSGAPGGPPGAGGPVSVEVGVAELLRLEDDAQAVGTLRAVQSVMLRPEVSGRVMKLGVADGQRVKKGQLVVQLDDTLQQAQLQQAMAQASIARTNVQRNRELLAQSFISQSAVDQAQANLEVAEAQVALAQAQLQRMKVVAPFDGLAGIRAVNVGDYVKDGAEVVQIDDVSTVWVDFRLPERHLASLRAGQAVSVALDALPGRSYQARVEALDAQLDASGRSILVRARVANPAAELRGGMFARARIVFGVKDKAVMVPEEALVPMGDQQFIVKVIQGADGAPRAQRLKARTGTRMAGKVEVLEGVSAGETVVTAGHARLMRGEGQVLRIVQVGGARRAEGQAPQGASGPAAGRASAASTAG